MWRSPAILLKQSENVNSQGILLFDAHATTVRHNLVEGNRVGLYIEEESTGNRLESNGVSDNFIGIQLIGASNNTITGNRFSGNVADAQAQNSTDNEIMGNFWDSFRRWICGYGEADIGSESIISKATIMQSQHSLFFEWR